VHIDHIFISLISLDLCVKMYIFIKNHIW